MQLAFFCPNFVFPHVVLCIARASCAKKLNHGRWLSSQVSGTHTPTLRDRASLLLCKGENSSPTRRPRHIVLVLGGALQMPPQHLGGSTLCPRLTQTNQSGKHGAHVYGSDKNIRNSLIGSLQGLRRAEANPRNLGYGDSITSREQGQE